MPNTKVPIELSSTPGIIDNSTVTAITIDSAGAATFSGDIDVDGTTNLDIVDIDGAVDMASTLAVSGVASFADGSSSAPSITNTGDSNTGIYFPADEKIGFTAGGVPTFALDNQGNLLYTNSFQIQSDAQDGQIAIAGGNNSNDGANLGFYGPSHASLANIGKFRADTVETFRFGPTGSVFNEGSADLDFRVESDNDANALFVDGADGTVTVSQNLAVGAGTSRSLIIGQAVVVSGTTITTILSGMGAGMSSAAGGWAIVYGSDNSSSSFMDTVAFYSNGTATATTSTTLTGSPHSRTYVMAGAALRVTLGAGASGYRINTRATIMQYPF